MHIWDDETECPPLYLPACLLINSWLTTQLLQTEDILWRAMLQFLSARGELPPMPEQFARLHHRGLLAGGNSTWRLLQPLVKWQNLHLLLAVCLSGEKVRFLWPKAHILQSRESSLYVWIYKFWLLRYLLKCKRRYKSRATMAESKWKAVSPYEFCSLTFNGHHLHKQTVKRSLLENPGQKVSGCYLHRLYTVYLSVL